MTSSLIPLPRLLKRTFAVLLLLNIVSLPAFSQTLIGAWTYGDASDSNETSGVFLFLANGYYFQAEYAGGGDYDFERGVYSWNSITGAFSVTPIQNENSEIGLNTVYAGALVSVAGNTLTMTNPDGPDTESAEFSRVTGESPIVGGWLLGDASVNNSGSAAIVFLNNGYFFYMENAMSDAGPSGSDGIELGAYSWNPITGAILLGVFFDTNGDIGASSIDPNASIFITGSELTLFNPDGPDTGSVAFQNVSAIPEPSTTALLSGLAAVFAAGVWRRSRTQR